MMDSKFNKVLVTFAVFFASFGVKAQSELAFDGAFEVSFLTTSSTPAQTSYQSFVVPSGSVYKITSAGCGPTPLQVQKAGACYLHINDNEIYVRNNNYGNPEMPIWLKSGTYNLVLISSYTAGCRGFIYGVKFKVE